MHSNKFWQKWSIVFKVMPFVILTAMFRSKRSTLKSRAQVKLERTFKLLHTKSDWTGIPIMAANMSKIFQTNPQLRFIVDVLIFCNNFVITKQEFIWKQA